MQQTANTSEAFEAKCTVCGGEHCVHIAGEHSPEINGLSRDFNNTNAESYSAPRGLCTVEGRSSSVERSRHMGEAGGSIPSAPTVRVAPYNRGDPQTRKFYRVTPENLQKYFWSKVKISAPDECWPWLKSCDEHGYGKVCFGKKAYIASRLAYALATGREPGKALICHHCDNRSCCNPAHLYAGTSKTNVDDMIRRGRTNPTKGERNHFAKLNAEKVENVRLLIERGKTNIEIGRLVGVHHSTISKIRTGCSWK